MKLPHTPREWTGLALLFAALVFNAVALAPEIRIAQVSLNDLVLHLAASERLGESLARGEPFLDPWVSEWATGYPVWRTYQPVPHLIGAAAIAGWRPLADPATSFAGLNYLLLVLLPLSFYLGGRWLGLPPHAAGLAACLALAPSAPGDLDRYGLGYGASVWRGSGLFTQLVAVHFFALTLGLVTRALDSGRRRPLAAAGLALTALSHIIFGYVTFLSSALLAWVGPAGERSRRLVRLATVAGPALLLLAWFVVPLFGTSAEVNHSRWEDAHKWDSHGAPKLLGDLVHGRLLDSGRAPVLTLIAAAGTLAAALSYRDPVARRLLGLASLWFGLFFGRVTWGHLLKLVGVPRDLHIHRFQASFEACTIWLAAWGIARAVDRLVARRSRPALVLAAGLAIGVVAGLGYLGHERAVYLELSAEWGDVSLAAYARERPDLEAAIADLRAILAERPGRVSAGKAATWGKDFRIGSVAAYAFLARAHLDCVSFLYHSMSRPSDVLVLRGEDDPAHDVAFGIRAVLAPAGKKMPPHLRPRSVHGRYAVYESSPEGYFGVVDVAGRYTGPPATTYEPSAAWLSSDLLGHGVVMALDPQAPYGPAVARFEPLPPRPPENARPAGWVLAESKEGETYRARLKLLRPAHAFIKITWFPDLVATVDGETAPIYRVTPGFGAVPVPEGEHEVVVRWRPGPLKPALLVLGIGLFAAVSLGLGRPRTAALLEAARSRLAGLGHAAFTPRAQATLALVVVAVLALRPLFRGQLVGGHDASEYPPRQVEMSAVVADLHLPPVWAPDLGRGHGQPLFEFAPPLVYLAALPFQALGCGLADALQLALALLHLAGAAAVYRLARRARTTRASAVAAAAAWLFAPYTSLDLYVRGNFMEAAAVAVAPIALLGLVRAADRPSFGRIAAGGAAIALLPLSHNAAPVLLLPGFAIVLGLRAMARAGAGDRRGAARDLLGGGSAIAAGLLLSAYFWLPALLEKPLVRTDLLRQDFLDWRVHILSPLQLLSTAWGHGVSVAGSADGMGFGLGPIHLLLAGLGLLAGLFLYRGADRAEWLAFALAALLGAWLATSWSAPLWARVETLQYLAYPWRALMLPGLFLALLAVPALDLLGRRLSKVALLAVVALNLGHTEPAGYQPFDQEFYLRERIASQGMNTTTREEYEPRGVEARPPWRAEPLVGLDGTVRVREVSFRTQRREYAVGAERPTRLEATLFFYPGWRATLDGHEVAIAPRPVAGTILLDLPAGEHTLVLELRPTPLRRRATWLSLAAALGLAAGSAWTVGRGGRRRRGPVAADPPGC